MSGSKKSKRAAGTEPSIPVKKNRTAESDSERKCRQFLEECYEDFQDRDKILAAGDAAKKLYEMWGIEDKSFNY